MQKWEYLVMVIKQAPQGTQRMNELGAEGWELVAIVRHQEMYNPEDRRDYYWKYYYYFKRAQ